MIFDFGLPIDDSANFSFRSSAVTRSYNLKFEIRILDLKIQT